METYIINLEKDTDRKEYISTLLSNYPCFHLNFINAVNGKEKPSNELQHKFNNIKAFKRYGRECSPAEIGCTLSHYSIYEKLIFYKIPYALILEDDIEFIGGGRDVQNIIYQLDKHIKGIKEPTIILLSGAYTYFYSKKVSPDITLANVHGATLAHSYIINAQAAQILTSKQPPYTQADDWKFISQCGIKVKALLPHLVDQNRNKFDITQSNIWEETHRFRKLTLSNISESVINKLLSFIGNKEQG